MHSFYFLRHAIAIRELGAPEPGVNLLVNTRLNLQPVLRVLAFLSPRMRQLEYQQFLGTINVFVVALGMELASVRS